MHIWGRCHHLHDGNSATQEKYVLLLNIVFTLWLMSFDLCEFSLIITQLRFLVVL